MQRLMRAAIGTNNIDNCSRVCHSPTSFALRKSFGLSGATGSFDDFDHADATILIGANPTEGHPVVGARIKQATLRGMKLVTIDPRRIELSDYGVLHLAPRPGTNAAVMLGIAHVVAPRRARSTTTSSTRAPRATTRCVELLAAVHARRRRGDHRRPRRRPRARRAHLRRGRERLLLVGPRRDRAQVRLRGRAADLQRRADDRQGRPARLGAAAAARAEQRPGLVGHGRAAGHLHRLPLASATRTSRARFEEAWGVTIPREKGYTIPQMFDAAVAGDLKAMYIFGEDVAQTDPNTAHVVAALENLEFLVCQDIFETETTQVRRRDPAGVVVPREVRARSRTPSGASSSSTPRSSRPAARAPTSTSSRRSRARSATRWASRRPRTRWTRSPR